MAKFDGKFIKGKVGRTVYKKYRNKQIIQEVPVFTASSHTEASKSAAKIFGKASSLAMNLRDILNPIITDFTDGQMVNRLNSEVVQILNQSKDVNTGTFTFDEYSFSRLNGFEFNQTSMVRNIFHARPELQATSSQLTISIPEIQLPKELIFPKEIGSCMFSLGLGMFDLKHGRETFSTIQTNDIKYEYKPGIVPSKQFNFEIESGCLCIAVISLQFMRDTFAGKMFYNTIDFNPVAILKAFIAEGEVDPAKTKNWYEMDFKTTS